MTTHARRAALVLLALAGMLLGLTGPAQAAPGDPFHVYTEPYLTGSPQAGMNPVCKSGRIPLAAGTYDWQEALGDRGQYNVRWQTASRTVNLGANSYTLQVCIYPKPGYYLLLSTLTPDGGGSAATLQSGLFAINSGTWRLWTRIQLT